jgi:hypothetical protein
MTAKVSGDTEFYGNVCLLVIELEFGGNIVIYGRVMYKLHFSEKTYVGHHIEYAYTNHRTPGTITSIQLANVPDAELSDMKIFSVFKGDDSSTSSTWSHNPYKQSTEQNSLSEQSSDVDTTRPRQLALKRIEVAKCDSRATKCYFISAAASEGLNVGDVVECRVIRTAQSTVFSCVIKSIVSMSTFDGQMERSILDVDAARFVKLPAIQITTHSSLEPILRIKATNSVTPEPIILYCSANEEVHSFTKMIKVCGPDIRTSFFYVLSIEFTLYSEDMDITLYDVKPVTEIPAAFRLRMPIPSDTSIRVGNTRIC